MTTNSSSTTDRDRPLRVLAVCLGNICRSPTAEAALRDAARGADADIEVVSAGTGTWHIGKPPHPEMTRAAASRGLILEGTAAHVDADMLAGADLVLAMDASNRADLQRLADEAAVTTPIMMFRHFDPDAPGTDVPDPYGGPDAGYDEVVEICQRTAPHVIAYLVDHMT